MIPFNLPAYTSRSLEYVNDAIAVGDLGEKKRYVQCCESWLKQYIGIPHVYAASSCTHALEMAALLLNIQPGDEIIMPSFTFVSAANAFVLRGGVPVFVDIRPDTMNIDETLIEQAITPKTRAIMVMHYAGVACDMDTVMQIASMHNLPVIEDAAHAIMGYWHDRPLGGIGTIGTFSFHRTKNLTGGEGGAIITNNPAYGPRLEVLLQKGTDRAHFDRGAAQYYSWVGLGSSWCMTELNAAYLYGNLQAATDITTRRRQLWDHYYEGLQIWEERGCITRPVVPAPCRHNGHIFYIKLHDISARTDFIAAMKECGITLCFHYVPLHSSPAGMRYGRLSGADRYTTPESARLVRLPLYYGMSDVQIAYVMDAIHRYFVKIAYR